MLKIFRQSALPIGLDISDISLRLVQFTVSKTGKREVQAYVDKVIPKEAIIGDQIKNPRVLVSTIRAAIKNPQFGKFVGNEVVASIPETKSFVRVIEMPQMSETETKEAIKWEAEQYVPLPIGQVYLDWVALEKYDGGNEGRMKVLLIASPRDYVDDLTSYIKEAGLQPVALEVESQATARSLIGRNEHEITSLLLDINALRSSFIVYDQGSLQFTSSIPIAGHSFTESITKVLNIPFDKAEAVKRKVGLEKEAESGMVRKALLPVLSNLVAEIRNTLKFYEEHEGEKSTIKRDINRRLQQAQRPAVISVAEIKSKPKNS